MDSFKPFQTFDFDSFTFNAQKYEEYSEGQLISKGHINIAIVCKTQENNIIKTYLINNTLSDKIQNEFEFDTLFTLEDRMQLTIFPKNTNIEDTLFTYLKWTIQPTRESKLFTNIEPIVGHIFTDNMNIVKITFKMTNPERIIELY